MHIPEEEIKRIIENAYIPLKGEKPSIHRKKWNTKKVSIRKEGTTNIEMVYGFKIDRYDPALDFLRILGNCPHFKLWDQSLKRYCFSASSKLEWTSTEGGFFICLTAPAKKEATEINKRLIPMLENLHLSESDVETVKKIRTLEVLEMKDEGNLTERSLRDMLDKVKEVNRERIISLGDKYFNEENAVRAFVGSVDYSIFG
jgi:predicted Zn-dependent peptidase